MYVRDTKDKKESQTINTCQFTERSRELLHIYCNNIFGTPHAEYTKHIIQVISVTGFSIQGSEELFRPSDFL